MNVYLQLVPVNQRTSDNGYLQIFKDRQTLTHGLRNDDNEFKYGVYIQDGLAKPDKDHRKVFNAEVFGIDNSWKSHIPAIRLCGEVSGELMDLNGNVTAVINNIETRTKPMKNSNNLFDKVVLDTMEDSDRIQYLCHQPPDQVPNADIIYPILDEFEKRSKELGAEQSIYLPTETEDAKYLQERAVVDWLCDDQNPFHYDRIRESHAAIKPL